MGIRIAASLGILAGSLVWFSGCSKEGGAGGGQSSSQNQSRPAGVPSKVNPPGPVGQGKMPGSPDDPAIIEKYGDKAHIPRDPATGKPLGEDGEAGFGKANLKQPE